MNRLVQSGAAISFWGLVILSWMFERPIVERHSDIALFFVGLFLPLTTLLLAWRQQIQFLYSCAFPLSMLPFILLYPESMSHQFHSPWTYVPMGLLWFLIIVPSGEDHAEEIEKTLKVSRKSFQKRYILLVSWFTIGILGIFLGRLFVEEDTVPTVQEWLTFASVIWIGPWLIWARYHRERQMVRSSEGRTL